MKAEIKKLPQSQVEITITVAYDDYKKAEKSAIEEISKEIKIDGFRSGNIPEDIVRKQVDEKTIAAVTLEKVIPVTYTKAVKDNDVQVIAQPKVDIKKPVKKEGDEMVYTATVAVMPEVKVGDYKKIKVARPKVKVEKKQVDETIQMIMNRFAEWGDVKRKAKEGDRVEITFTGYDEKGEEIPNTASKNHPLILGSKSMVPGFEEAIVGMEVGEEKEFDVKFPKEYHAKAMQDKKVKFKLTLGRLEEKKDQKLDEALVEKVSGQKQSVDEFKKRVEEDLMQEMEHRTRQEHDNNVVKEIIKITKVDLPEILIIDEISQMKEEQKARIQQQGLNWEQYLQHIKKTDEDFAKDHKKAAEERLLARFGVTHIIKDAKVGVEDKEVDEKIKEMGTQYPKEQQSQFKEYYKKGSDNYRNLKNNMAADKLIDMLSK
ncbi:trigger factor [Patescibacteria group bacterium]|nr:trigger factor [Patescibacteria group bacterium]